ncbi:type II toxin-antitoxin system RelB/DinJ family antitoxin [Anaerobiospirillum succiniciproducens]|uniref:type II toxin-antitoxin system RelB/DinJ family antitoxin n=1 Tax=Anaerobiospirillum succiniciproducens TaxID=13335 RepID=UPI00248EFC30|nr:type II toxin-antitoxin system RelB/DinJ family antitoxin [Anaerobiospirillum succiniciproducens]
MTSTSVNVTVRMDSKVKAQVDELYSSLGMNMSTAINMFVRQCLRERQLPFQPSLNIPNQETIRAIEESNEMIRTGNFKSYTLEEALQELDK